MKKIVLALAATAVIAMVSAPVMAATQWNFGGMIRYMTFWNQTDGGKHKVSDLQGGGAGLNSDGKLEWGTQVNTRIMMWMKSDTLDGFIELGYDTDGNSVWTREYWGRYKLNDSASIIIGQQHQLYSSFISRQAGLVDLNMNGIGTAFRPPTPKIVFNYGGVGHLFFLNSGFSFALAKPEADKPTEMLDRTPASTWAGATADIDTLFPQVQAAYTHYADTWRIKLAGAYQHTKLKSINSSMSMINPIAKKSQTIHSWLLTIDGDIAFGPLWLAANATVGQNWGNAGMMNSEFGATLSPFGYSPSPFTTMGFGIQDIASGHFDVFDIWNGKGKWENTTSWMLSAVAAYQLTEALRFEAGAGFRYDNNDVYETSHKLWNVYLQAAYTVAPGFEIVPEIGYIDRGKSPIDKTDAGYLWYAGAQWNMYF